MEERRKLERFTLRLPAKIKVVEPESHVENRVHHLWTREISSSGGFFHTVIPFAEGTKVSIELLLDMERFERPDSNRTHVKLTGKVVRVESGGIAVRFDNGYKMFPVRSPRVLSAGFS